MTDHAATTTPPASPDEVTLVLRGNPTATNVAAVVAALTAWTSPTPTAASLSDPSQDRWGSPALILHRQTAAASTLPNAGYA